MSHGSETAISWKIYRSKKKCVSTEKESRFAGIYDTRHDNDRDLEKDAISCIISKKEKDKTTANRIKGSRT